MKFQRPMFIVFEGLDGSGKSTTAALLAERLDAHLMTTPSPIVRKFRDELVSSLGESQEARQLFYLSTVFSASDEVARRLAEGQSVVLDRYFLSTQAYAAFRGSRLALDAVQHLLHPADVTVFMDVVLPIRVERLQQRGAGLADLETITPEADLRLREEHELRAHFRVVGCFLRDHGSGRPNDVVERLLSVLGNQNSNSSFNDFEPFRFDGT